ncbi:unnamed protein product [Aphanomyces euteiches]|uniref:Uncharacterized protein n=1 Tax=Aphanomyces euteiches TaxID=100861 RepID=A0A6G0WNF0_9STRA|nr:hypothetical protein Ae201684_013438 [Aphanomyces euteiches]KAH9063098.1 hypothetical protein Ae201684P_009363 [Aphanomyces euteiches]KAH9145455.1 hypothetical protein AeRB84_010629 [Aphanomyces euteiches]
MKNAVYVAATRQHVGKTSTCLGLLQGLTNRFEHIGFLKPVGQQSVLVDGNLRVDKDVRVAKEVFGLSRCDYADMSPVVIPPGYTRDYLDGKITLESQLDKIHKSFKRISERNEFTVVEGTGHTGVGSIVNVSNARVAADLGVDMVLIANGGIGSTFDDLSLNRAMCKEYGVRIRGVILNKVRPDKVDMMWDYFPKALKQWDIPLLGVVPDLPLLAQHSMMDYEDLFHTELLSGHARRMQQYKSVNLVTSGLRRFLVELSSNEFNDTLFVAHASRNDIILGFLSHSQNFELKTGQEFGGGLILTGLPPKDQPQEYMMDIISRTHLPVLYAPYTTFEAMDMMGSFTAKFNATDVNKVLSCAKHYEQCINFDALLRH